MHFIEDALIMSPPIATNTPSPAEAGLFRACAAAVTAWRHARRAPATQGFSIT